MSKFSLRNVVHMLLLAVTLVAIGTSRAEAALDCKLDSAFPEVEMLDASDSHDSIEIDSRDQGLDLRMAASQSSGNATFAMNDLHSAFGTPPADCGSVFREADEEELIVPLPIDSVPRRRIL